MLDYLNHFSKFISSFLRIEVLRKCLDNNNIPDFLRFRVPDKGVFSDQAVHRFPLRLLRTEISQANADRAKASRNLAKAKGVARRGKDKKWWIYLNLQSRCSDNNLISLHKKNLENFSERQDWSLKNLDEMSVRILDEVILSFGPKHLVRDKSMNFTSSRTLIFFCLKSSK